MNPAKRVEKLRHQYERALARSEARGAAYHQAVHGLLAGGGPELRQLAEELGLVDQPTQPNQLREQVRTANPTRPRRRRHVRAAAALAAILVLATLTLAALRVAQAPPFVPSVRVPLVIGLPEEAAIRRVEDAGLTVRLLRYWRSIPGVRPGSVVGVSHAAGSPATGERLAKGSTITLYIVMGHKPAKKAKSRS